MMDLLHEIASPDVEGVPGACKDMDIGPLLAVGYVTFGYVPAEQITEDCAWVRLTDTGREALSNPSPTEDDT